ncbi:phage baseplate assembly protein [Azospirillum sp. SYSU D00513]|uniref:phage baseplate assembly protein n=1 Tax=Azospirillum sp. SYSU D00513 TaxID=2812561 RepID=UPI001A95B741|nr:contractile injection system protein, VgrG/Pvc8 family [Azospirillum sp. SYSU D00513]
MSDDNRVRVTVNGTDFAGWKSVRIAAGIDRQARDFDLSVTDVWPGSDVARRIGPGDECKVWIGADLVLTGYVDATPISYDAKQVTISVKGRSRTADLVDCSALNEPGQWKARKVEQIAADLARPYGVEVIAAVDTGEPVADHQLQQGESVFESIDRLLKARALLSTDDAQGRMILTRAGSDKAGTALVVSQNILTGSAALDFKDRYSEYVVKGQKAVTEDDADDGGDDGDISLSPVEKAAQVKSTQPDSGIKRRRVLLIVESGQPDGATARDRARFEAAHRAGKSYQTTYTVQGWRQGDGKLWVPNQLVQIKDPIIGFDMEMLIAEVSYSLSESGTTTTLTVAPKAAYELLPETPGSKKKRKGGGKEPALNPPIVDFG